MAKFHYVERTFLGANGLSPDLCIEAGHSIQETNAMTIIDRMVGISGLVRAPLTSLPTC
jgi:hypothetical protein